MTTDYLQAGSVMIPLDEISVSFARSGGPGGQNVNKVETKVTVRFRPRDSSALRPGQVKRIEEKLASRLTTSGELVLSSEKTRFRERNREDALARLGALIEKALKRPRPRRRTKPTRASVERRLTEKKRRAKTKRHRREPPEE